MSDPKQPDTSPCWSPSLVVSFDRVLGHCCHSFCCHQWEVDVLHSATASGCNRVWNLPWDVVCSACYNVLQNATFVLTAFTHHCAIASATYLIYTGTVVSAAPVMPSVCHTTWCNPDNNNNSTYFLLTGIICQPSTLTRRLAWLTHMSPPALLCLRYTALCMTVTFCCILMLYNCNTQSSAPLAFDYDMRLTFRQAIQSSLWLVHSARQVRLLQVIGAPLAAGLLALDGYLGLAGWQWLFIVEGIPTVLMGVYTKIKLAESPAKASFLTPVEKAWLQQRHADSKVPVVLPLLQSLRPASRLCCPHCDVLQAQCWQKAPLMGLPSRL